MTDPFHKARLKLMGVFLGCAIFIIGVMNLGVYGLFVSDLPDKIEGTLSSSQRLEIEKNGDRLEYVMLIVCISMLALTTFASYILAGYVLRPIKKTYESQKQFVADAAHELRTPLTIMKLGAESTIATRGSLKHYQSLAQDSLEEIDSMSGLVEDLLFLAKHDHSLKKQVSSIDLDRIVQNQGRLLEKYAASHKVSLNLDITECKIAGNKSDFERLISNLLVNAINYNKPGGKVKIRLLKHASNVELIVADTGIGIAKKDLGELTNRFYKVDSSRSGQGVGLGLSIVEEIADTYGLKLLFESKLDEGTKVSVLFPIIQK